jgi:hypothetical protein
MRTSLLIVSLGSALALAGCADMPGARRTSTVAANPDHPRAEAMLGRGAPSREPARESAREASRESVRETARESNRDPVRDAQATLREGIRLYNEGDFADAIARLTAPEIQAASAATRTMALKYTAFSYCVTQRPAPCRLAFDKALRIDPNFTLAPGEQGHPMWGPVFDKARASR